MSKMSESENRMLNLQMQMRQNTTDVSDFVKDLDIWEAEIKSKDEKLKKSEGQLDTKLPPVRNSLDIKKKKKIKKASSDGKKKPKRISSYDYRAWDKFDVDQACESIPESKSSSSEYETDEEWEVERKKQAAVMEKDKGNDYFKRGDYENAIECYTKGADFDPTNPLLPANRAMALLKQNKFAAAEIDCTVSLTLDPLYTKAYLRRGTARLGLAKFVAAKEDYDRVLQLEPQNKKAKADLEIIDKEMVKENLVSHTEPVASKEMGIVHAISKAPHERSQKPLRRIHIEEIGMDDDLQRKSAVARVEQGQGHMKKELQQRDNEMFQRFTATSPGDIGSLSSSQTSVEYDRTKNGLEGGKILANSESDNSESERALPQVVTTTDHTNVTIAAENRTKTDAVQNGKESPRQLSPREPTVPTTSFQFQADYKVLKNNPEAFYRYFKKIEPSDYTKLFGQFLDAEVLLKILHVFKEYYIQMNEDFLAGLQSLTRVKRFSMVAMFFSAKEKQVLRDLFAHLRSSGKHPEDDVNRLAKLYDIR